MSAKSDDQWGNALIVSFVILLIVLIGGWFVTMSACQRAGLGTDYAAAFGQCAVTVSGRTMHILAFGDKAGMNYQPQPQTAIDLEFDKILVATAVIICLAILVACVIGELFQ